MTKPTLTIGSTDLSEYVQSMKVTISSQPEPYKHSYTVNQDPYKWNPINDCSTRKSHTVSPVVWMTPPYEQTHTWSIRCSMVNLDGYLKTLPNENLVRLIRKALRTYPKRMSRAQRKEARAREQRRLGRIHKQITRSR